MFLTQQLIELWTVKRFKVKTCDVEVNATWHLVKHSVCKHWDFASIWFCCDLYTHVLHGACTHYASCIRTLHVSTYLTCTTYYSGDSQNVVSSYGDNKDIYIIYCNWLAMVDVYQINFLGIIKPTTINCLYVVGILIGDNYVIPMGEWYKNLELKLCQLLLLYH